MSRSIVLLLVVCFVSSSFLSLVYADNADNSPDALFNQSMRFGMDDGVPSQDNGGGTNHRTFSPSQWWDFYSYFLSYIFFPNGRLLIQPLSLFGSGLPRQAAAGEGPLEIVAAAGAVEIQQFPGKE